MIASNIRKDIERLKAALFSADAIVIGAGAGLSTAAGFTYSGERFEKYFSDFGEKYGFHDMYAGGFYPYDTLEEHWAYWSRYILVNRYMDPPKPIYQQFFDLVKDKDYFVITTNVDHCFQKAGFDKKRLFYTQGDYGLFQCPGCGKPMTMNLRADDKFVQDEGWDIACGRYERFLNKHNRDNILYLELGVGYNTPAIIKYPFWRLTAQNRRATYACINYGEAFCPEQIQNQSICLNDDIVSILSAIEDDG